MRCEENDLKRLEKSDLINEIDDCEMIKKKKEKKRKKKEREYLYRSGYLY